MGCPVSPLVSADQECRGPAAAVTTNTELLLCQDNNTPISDKMPQTRGNTELSMGDRISFVFGLTVIIFGEYLILCKPHVFTYFYTFLLTVLVAKR